MPPFMLAARLLPLLLLSAITVQCGTGGHLVSEEDLARVEVGTSTRADVRARLGEPEAVSTATLAGEPVETWHYPLARYASDPATGVPPIGVADSFPISRGRRGTTRVAIRFDRQGFVQDIQVHRP